ncbi:MAG: DUF4271 domain-containing protein [Flavobacteriales bacterium]|nr:DUF4271 domain-containing protein [Flavobacteriales bacterium]NCP90009.1 DUF4271 domain-containing protein [Flavobacteriales bacterium]NCQ56468.1 DUF4271 domain-containing protein [Flavobacteriales bacterium]PIY09826.1 MAG: DUF4271 domain-containing protein [Flavobacteriaceae bacterium CG_4_10_14_3_um_filter_33_47]PJB16646.1 MAG: DUF4271 domain-containing protein [Flavobacteriaceae bacterium CG_4_9_14_3_um_filter_33_16]
MLRNAPSYELFTILIVLGIVFIASAKMVFPKRFNDFVYVLGNSKYLKIYSREQKFFDKFDAFLFVNLVISLTIFIFICLGYEKNVLIPTVNDLFKLSVGISIFILAKVLLERLIGSLFEIDPLIDQYLFQKITYKNFFGLLLLPINLLLIYRFKPSLILLYSILGMLLIINFVGLITSIKTNQSLIKQNLFYFILYLCALEIAPYIILYKVFFHN